MLANLSPKYKKDAYECIELFTVQFEQFQEDSKKRLEVETKAQIENNLINIVEKICEARIAHNQTLFTHFQECSEQEIKQYYHEVFQRNIKLDQDSQEPLKDYFYRTMQFYKSLSEKIKEAIVSDDEYALDFVYITHTAHLYVNFCKQSKYDCEFSHVTEIFKILKTYLSPTHQTFLSKIWDVTKTFNLGDVYKAFESIRDAFVRVQKQYSIIGTKFNEHSDSLPYEIATSMKFEFEALEPFLKDFDDYFHNKFFPEWEILAKAPRVKHPSDAEIPFTNDTYFLLRRAFDKTENLKNKLNVFSKKLDATLELWKTKHLLEELKKSEEETKRKQEGDQSEYQKKLKLKQEEALKAAKNAAIVEKELACVEIVNKQVIEFRNQRLKELKKYKEKIERNRIDKSLPSAKQGDSKKDSEDFIISDLEQSQLLALYYRLNPSQKSILEKLFNANDKSHDSKVTFSEFENLVSALSGKIDNSSGSSHFKITLPNTYEDWDIDESLVAYVDLPLISAGSWKQHGGSHNNEELKGYAFKLCVGALTRAGITKERLDKALQMERAQEASRKKI